MVSAQWADGTVVSPVRVHSEVGVPLLIAKMWPKVCVHELPRTAMQPTAVRRAVRGAEVSVREERGRGLPDVDPLGRASFPTEAGKTYVLEKC